MYSERLIQRNQSCEAQEASGRMRRQEATRKTALGAHSLVRYDNVWLLYPKL